MTHTITKSNAELYQVRSTKGRLAWGDIVLICGKNFVSVMASSDFGSFSHDRFSTSSPKEFLCGMNLEYAMNKLTQGKLYVPDLTLYPSEIKEQIISSRRCHILTRQEARKAWTEMLDICEEHQSSEPLLNALYEHDLFTEVFVDYDGLPSGSKMCSSALSFWNEVWLPFIESLKRELQAANQ
jgi:hypothetical protein